MLRVSKVEDRLARPPSPARPAVHASGDCVIIRSGHGDGGRRGDGPAPLRDGPAGVSEQSAGARALGMRLIMMPAGTRGMPHLHPGHESALYLVSGETEVWHGAGLVKRSTMRAGDFIYIPPGTPHLAVNRSAAISIAVVAHTDPADAEGTVVIELPRHLAGLLSLPVVVQE